jgi:hypothetical protein
MDDVALAFCLDGGGEILDWMGLFWWAFSWGVLGSFLLQPNKQKKAYFVP